MVTRIIWKNREGRRMEHSMGFQCTLSYARDWFRRSIEESQPTAFMTTDQRRESQLCLLDIQNAI